MPNVAGVRAIFSVGMGIAVERFAAICADNAFQRLAVQLVAVLIPPTLTAVIATKGFGLAPGDLYQWCATMPA